MSTERGKSMTAEEQNEILLENRRMRKALEFIRDWQLPMVDDRRGGRASYESIWGSNGARDYIRKFAEDVL